MQWWRLISFRLKNKKNIDAVFWEAPKISKYSKPLNYNHLFESQQTRIASSYAGAIDCFMSYPIFNKLIIYDVKKNTIPLNKLPLSLALQNAYNKNDGDLLSEREIYFCIKLILLKYLECSFKVVPLLEVYFTDNYEVYIKSPKHLDEDDFKSFARKGFFIEKCNPYMPY